MMNKVVVTGSGQLAWELERTAPSTVDLVILAYQDLDIADGEAVTACLDGLNPTAVINAAAYTAVDGAEQEPDLAHAANALGPENLARHCEVNDAYFLHISTDFVFDGNASRPYAVDSVKNPLSVYGQSKAIGEDAVTAASDKFGIIRTAWVYSSQGNNFVKTMLRLMVEKPALNVVGDQLGSPTWARGLAQVCWASVEQRLSGMYHWTDAGVASWYDFAVAIQELAYERDLLETLIPVNSIASEAYPTPAQRPAFGVLDKRKILTALPTLEHVHWRRQLAEMLNELSATQRF